MNRYQEFLNDFFSQINIVGLDVEGYDLDHIAYQASSSKDYHLQKQEFERIGEEVSEEVIGGRRVAIYKLFSPIKYQKYSISALEVIEPKEDQIINSSFQHAEFVMLHPFEEYIEKHPDIKWDTSSMYRDDFAHLKLNFNNGLTLKFLQKPILEMVS